MVIDNNNNNEISLSDEDPTLELEPLPENYCPEIEAVAVTSPVPDGGDESRLDNDQLQKKCDRLEAQIASLSNTNDSLNFELERSRQHVSTLEEQLVLVHDSQQELLSAARRLPRRDAKDCLVLIGTNGGGSDTWLLNEGTITIGSNPDCDIPIESRFVSRQHAQLIMSQHGAVLEDLNSTNGTFLNARRIKKRAISTGDLITVGKTRFRFDKQLAVAGEMVSFESGMYSERT